MTVTITDTDLLTRWFGFDATRLTPNALDKAHSLMLYEITDMVASLPEILEDTGIDYRDQPFIEWVKAYRLWKQDK